MTESPLAGKVTLVTGAGQGIGHAIAREPRRHGARVGLADLNGAGDQPAATEIDVTSEVQVSALVADTVRDYGALDIFVNNAGIRHDAPLKRMTVPDFDAVIAVHLRGTWLGDREAVAAMREREPGSIVKISSRSGCKKIGASRYSRQYDQTGPDPNTHDGGNAAEVFLPSERPRCR